MTSLLNELEKHLTVRITNVVVKDDHIEFFLDDRRIISFPLDWSPRLWHGTPAERNRWELIGRGIGVHWPELDEDISLAGVLLGLRSGESERSLQRWLKRRKDKAGSLPV